MLIDQIDQDLKSAMKEKNETALSALRNLKAALKNYEIEKHTDLTDADVLQVLGKKVKQHKDSIESFKAGNREDLVAVEIAQMQILEKYLPAQMDEAELTDIIKKVIVNLNAGASDFGKVMKEVVAKVKGRAGGTVISKLVKQELDGK